MVNKPLTVGETSVTIANPNGKMKLAILCLSILNGLLTVGTIYTMIVQKLFWFGVPILIIEMAFGAYLLLALIGTSTIVMFSDKIRVQKRKTIADHFFSEFEKVVLFIRGERYIVLFSPRGSNNKREKRAINYCTTRFSTTYDGYICLIINKKDRDKVLGFLKGRLPVLESNSKTDSLPEKVAGAEIPIKYSQSVMGIVLLFVAVPCSAIVIPAVLFDSIKTGRIIPAVIFVLLAIIPWLLFAKLVCMTAIVTPTGIQTRFGKKVSFYEYSEFNSAFVMEWNAVTYVVFCRQLLEENRLFKIRLMPLRFDYGDCIVLICTEEQVKEIHEIADRAITITPQR